MENAPPKQDSPPWEPKSKKPKRGLIRKLLLWLFIVGLAALIGVGLMPKPIEVEVATVKRGPLTVNVVEEGKTRIRNRYIVSAPVAGQLRRITLRAGDEVKGGDTILAIIEPTLAPLLDARSRAQAQARVDGADASREKATQALAMARTSLQFANTTWNRIKNIKEKGTVSDTDRDTAEMNAALRQREVQAAEFSIKVAEFELAQAKAALLQFDSPEKGDAIVEVRAPVSGRVLRVQQESATIVTPGSALLEIGDPTEIEIEAEILSRDAVAIKPGTTVSVDQWGGSTPLKATVRRVEPAAFTKVSSLGVEEQRVIVLADLVDPPAEAKALGDRYRVEVRIAIWHEPDTLLIPAGALFREGNDWKTFLFEQNKARTAAVQAGRTDGRMTQILSGLEVGTQVLMHPPDTVKDGVAIQKRGEK